MESRYHERLFCRGFMKPNFSLVQGVAEEEGPAFRKCNFRAIVFVCLKDP